MIDERNICDAARLRVPAYGIAVCAAEWEEI